MSRRLERNHLQFIIRSSFVILSYAGAAGRVEVVPFGGLPGFVRQIDRRALIIPDYYRDQVDVMIDIAGNPRLSLLFLVSNRTEALHVWGTASVTVDPEILAASAIDGQCPHAAIRVSVEEARLQPDSAPTWDAAARAVVEGFSRPGGTVETSAVAEAWHSWTKSDGSIH